MRDTRLLAASDETARPSLARLQLCEMLRQVFAVQRVALAAQKPASASASLSAVPRSRSHTARRRKAAPCRARASRSESGSRARRASSAAGRPSSAAAECSVCTPSCVQGAASRIPRIVSPPMPAMSDGVALLRLRSAQGPAHRRKSMRSVTPYSRAVRARVLKRQPRRCQTQWRCQCAPAAAATRADTHGRCRRRPVSRPAAQGSRCTAAAAEAVIPFPPPPSFR